MDRRSFIKSSTASAISLGVGFSLFNNEVIASNTYFGNPWIKIHQDNSITLTNSRTEMGQDVYTSISLLIAEELDCSLDAIRIEAAPFDPTNHGNAMLGGLQLTGASTSVAGSWGSMRKVGATVRTMLVSAAAKKWNVAVSSCSTNNGYVMSGAKRARYGELVDLLRQEPIPKDPALKNPADFKYIGKDIPRLDGQAKVDGTAIFGADVRVEGMSTAVLMRWPVVPPNIHGVMAVKTVDKVISYDADQARKLPGVLGVYRIDEGIAIVARDYHIAQQARKLVKITWDLGDTSELKDTETIMRRLKDAAAVKPGVVLRTQGDVKKATSAATSAHTATYELPFLTHANLEPLNCSARIANGELHIWGPMQNPHLAHTVGVSISGLPPEKVFVHVTFIGGGLGRKVEIDFVQEAVAIAKASGKGIRLMWSREDDTKHGAYRSAAYVQMEGALDAKGGMTALRVKLTSPSAISRAMPPFIQNGVDPFMVDGLHNLNYDVPNYEAEALIHEVGVRAGFYRSVGYSVNTYAIESFIDELALAAKVDPVAFRLTHLNGQPRAQAVLKLAAEKANWNGPQKPDRFLGVAQFSGYGSFIAVVAEISLDGTEPKVHKLVAAVDVGRVIRPTQLEGQIEGAMVLGIAGAMLNRVTFKDGVVQEGNFDTYKMLRFRDTPPVEVHIVNNDNPPGGAGELGLPPVAPAIANALARATGSRLRTLPFLDV